MEERPELFPFLLQHAGDAEGRHGSGALDSDVVVGHDGKIRLAELQLAREMALGVRDHVHRVPTHLLKPLRLRLRREAWAWMTTVVPP
jgi:hypothetical protein